MLLMKLLYPAGFARADMLKAVQMLASAVTRWTPWFDKCLHKLQEYVNATRDYTMFSWICQEDPLESLGP